MKKTCCAAHDGNAAGHPRAGRRAGRRRKLVEPPLCIRISNALLDRGTAGTDEWRIDRAAHKLRPDGHRGFGRLSDARATASSTSVPTVADYTVGDAPELEGLDVPLVANDASTRPRRWSRPPARWSRISCATASTRSFWASRPIRRRWCSARARSLRWPIWKGKKVRGSGRMTTKLLEALGAEGINIAFSEVPGSLQRGVIDCAVTGAGSGYSAGWWEVSDHL